MVDFIYDEHHHHLTQWDNNLLNPASMERYAAAIYCGALENCFGFIDGTVQPISHPSHRLPYSLY